MALVLREGKARGDEAIQLRQTLVAGGIAGGQRQTVDHRLFTLVGRKEPAPAGLCEVEVLRGGVDQKGVVDQRAAAARGAVGIETLDQRQAVCCGHLRPQDAVAGQRAAGLVVAAAVAHGGQERRRTLLLHALADLTANLVFDAAGSAAVIAVLRGLVVLAQPVQPVIAVIHPARHGQLETRDTVHAVANAPCFQPKAADAEASGLDRRIRVGEVEQDAHGTAGTTVKGIRQHHQPAVGFVEEEILREQIGVAAREWHAGDGRGGHTAGGVGLHHQQLALAQDVEAPAGICLDDVGLVHALFVHGGLRNPVGGRSAGGGGGWRCHRHRAAAAKIEVSRREILLGEGIRRVGEKVAAIRAEGLGSQLIGGGLHLGRDAAAGWVARPAAAAGNDDHQGEQRQ